MHELVGWKFDIFDITNETVDFWMVCMYEDKLRNRSHYQTQAQTNVHVMKVIYRLTHLSVWISPLVPPSVVFYIMLFSSHLFILTSHFTPLIVSPPFLSSHSPRLTITPVIQQHISTTCFRNGIVHYLTVSVQQGTSSLPLPSPHVGGREDKGRIRRRREAIDKDCWRKRDEGGESSKDWMDLWKSQREKESGSSSISPSFSLFHQLIASIRQIEGGSISLSDRLNNAAAAWLAFHHQPVPSTQIFGSSYSRRHVARDDILIQSISLGKIRERRGNTKTLWLLQTWGWIFSPQQTLS